MQLFIQYRCCMYILLLSYFLVLKSIQCLYFMSLSVCKKGEWSFLFDILLKNPLKWHDMCTQNIWKILFFQYALLVPQAYEYFFLILIFIKSQLVQNAKSQFILPRYIVSICLVVLCSGKDNHRMSASKKRWRDDIDGSHTHDITCILHIAGSPMTNCIFKGYPW